MRFACPPKTGRRSACRTTSQQPNPLAILSAAAVRCEIHGAGFFLPRMRCTSQSPTRPLPATPPRARVGRKISATATERRLPRRLKLRVHKKRKSISDLEPGMTIVISHGQNTIVPFFAEFIDRPCGNRGNEYEDQRDNVCSAAF